MIVPCNSTVIVDVHICGKPFSIFPNTYVLGPVQGSTSTCLGGFIASGNGLGSGEQSVLDRSAHKSDVE